MFADIVMYPWYPGNNGTMFLLKIEFLFHNKKLKTLFPLKLITDTSIYHIKYDSLTVTVVCLHTTYYPANGSFIY